MRYTFAALLVVVGTASAGIHPAEFRDPPADVKPMTWMHMMNGNASREGLAKDLQGLADAGVGGALIFSIKKNIADGEVDFNSQEFRDILVHGVREADRLGVKIGLHNCDGWSSSGGPWIEPEDAMKKLVWSEVVVPGGAVSVQLPRSPIRNGFYRDVAVVAYPATPTELAASHIPRLVSCSSGDEELANLGDDDLDTLTTLHPARGGGMPFLQWQFEEPYPAQSIFVEHGNRNGSATLFASADGMSFSKVVTLDPVYRPAKTRWAYEASFPTVTARFFKLEFESRIRLTDVNVGPFPRFPDWLAHGAMSKGGDTPLSNVTPPQTALPISWSDVQLLDPSVLVGDQLTVQLPPGTWRIMRFGYTLTGAFNHPATDVGRGLECDKLSKAALDEHFAAYVGKVAEACGELTGKVLYASEIDSYEMGWQNWTDGFENLFEAENGYDLLPFLPLIAGRYVGDMDTADAVLGDFQSLIAKLMTENYFIRFTELCHRYGMKSYIEPYGNGPLNGLTIGGNCDIPMGEFWMDQKPGTHYRTPVHAAHTYGKPVISAEAFTSWKDLNWKIHPWLMKPSGDYAWAQGINEFMFHRFAHQANPHVVPGMTMDSIGSHIDRTQTWWLSAGRAWMEYIQRGSYLLRLGVPVADLLVYAGDRAPQRAVSYASAGLPEGYNMDSCDRFVLMERVRVEEGHLVLPEGTRYSVLQLANCDRMHYATLRRLHELVAAGAVLVGPKPVGPLSYLERTEQAQPFYVWADKIWGDGTHPHRVGEGWVVPESHWQRELPDRTMEPDLTIRELERYRFVHRKVGNHDLYFIYNPEGTAVTFNCSFRIGDRIPELWFADTGRIERLGQFASTGNRTECAIDLGPHESVFVIFRSASEGLDPVANLAPPTARISLDEAGRMELKTKSSGAYAVEFASGRIDTVDVAELQRALPVSGPWKVQFDGVGLHEPTALLFSDLADWAEHERDDIRHFSGTAIYRKAILVGQEWFGDNRRILLDLGRVEIVAEVMVNGHNAGILWKPPFVADVTDLLRPGDNNFEIRVTSLWSNRLIGDERLEDSSGYKMKQKMPDWYINNEPMPEGPRSTFTTYNFYRQDCELLPSGLLGPVSLVPEAIVPITL